jgi:hypothetical protein
MNLDGDSDPSQIGAAEQEVRRKIILLPSDLKVLSAEC